jgi:Icc-related predicted phosphoesterase
LSHIYIAILGDLHGHITLAYRLLKRWEIEYNKVFSAIFQVGDLGAYPPPFRADKATMRFYEKDRDELSFVDYYQGSEEAAEILGDKALPARKISADMFFIKGNHEDFEYLNSLPQSGSCVDSYGKIFYLESGMVHTIQAGEHELRVAALGGVSQDNQSSRTSGSAYYTRAEYRRLCGHGDGVDIFLTHDTPFDTVFENAGSQDILEYIRDYKPRLHFCGHYHEDGEELEVPGDTRSFLLNEVNFRKPSRLNPGCIAILKISSNRDFQVEILDDGWLKEYRRSNFRSL